MDKETGNTMIKSMTAAFLAVVVLLSFASCSKEKKEFIPSFTNKDSVPVMDTRGMSMLISDSGITRYRLKAQVWQVYDREKDPYWYFPNGVYVEQFDSLLNIEASIEGDTCWYYTDAKLWELRGHVKVMNRKGEKFTGEELFWNEKAHLVYSNKLMMVESDSSYVYGYGFESDQSMTDYHIKNPHKGELFYVADSISEVQNDSVTTNTKQ